MKRVFVLAAFGAVLAALPAKAQPFAADLLPVYEVNTIVASMGMRPVGRPAWMRGRYVVAAIDRYGRDVNVVLDARDGHVLAVQPLGRGRFGPPPRGYAEPRYAPPYPVPPAAIPGGPPIDDDGEFFDDDRQQGAMPPPRTAARTAPAPRDPAITGSVTRSVPAARREAAREAAPLPRDVTPVPRLRPALARANDPGTKPAEASAGQPPAAARPDQAQPDAASKPAGVEAKAEATLEPAKPQAKKPEGKPQSRQVSVPQAAKPGQAKPETEGKPESRKPESRKPVAANPDTSKPGASKPDSRKPETSSESAAPKSATSKPEIRVIDLGKPETAPKPDDKPGVAIRF